MPQAGTLALSSFLNAVPASSSRKRSHAEITRSESRSHSPEHLPSKRRRLSPSAVFHAHLRSLSPRPPVAHHSEQRPRFEGDGYDYRSPAMTTQFHRNTATPTANDVVDLTADGSDDVSTASEISLVSDISRPLPSHQSRPTRVAEWRQAAHQQRRREAAQQDLDGSRRLTATVAHLHAQAHNTESRQQRAQHHRDHQPRAPPFGGQEASVIVLSDEEDEDFELEDFNIRSDVDTADSDSVASIASPDIQIVEERRIPQQPRPLAEVAADLVHIRTPFTMNLPDILRRGTQIVFGAIPAGVRDNEGFLDRLDGVPRRNQPNEGGPLNVTMDYGRTGFAMGGPHPFERSSETPQVVQEPYKAPPSAREGFTRTFAEEDIILCPMCGDELAIGKGDIKQQVWVVKGCGHVYCGECATNRSKGKSSRKGKGKENDRKLESVRSQPFSICQVDDCNQKVTAKSAMFPVYL